MKSYSTHTKTFHDGSRIDIYKLINLLKERESILYEISKIHGFNKSRKTGFSLKRFEHANLNYPIIINERGFLIDGRHRIIKAIESGQIYINALISTEEDLTNASFEGEAKLTEFKDLDSKF